MGTIQAAAGRARFRAAEHLTRQGHGHNHNMATHWPNTPNRKRVVFPAMPLKSLIWLVIHEINTYRSGPMWAKTFFRFHAGLVDVIKRDCTSASSFRSWLAICTMSTSNLIHPVRSLQESEASRHGNCNPLGELASTRITIDWQLQAKRKRRKLVGQGEMCSERHGQDRLCANIGAEKWEKVAPCEGWQKTAGGGAKNQFDMPDHCECLPSAPNYPQFIAREKLTPASKLVFVINQKPNACWWGFCGFCCSRSMHWVGNQTIQNSSSSAFFRVPTSCLSIFF